MTSDVTILVWSTIVWCEMPKQESSQMLAQFAYIPECSSWSENYEFGTQLDPRGSGYCVIVIVTKKGEVYL